MGSGSDPVCNGVKNKKPKQIDGSIKPKRGVQPIFNRDERQEG